MYGGRGREVKKERAKRQAPSKLAVGFESCRGPSIPVKHTGRKMRGPSRKRRGFPVGMTTMEWEQSKSSASAPADGPYKRERTPRPGEDRDVTGWGNPGGSTIEGGVRGG